ncbi:MAG: hypothetical protein GC154_08820 [bacterium]|nr:hypothetical protein [bacterium]
MTIDYVGNVTSTSVRPAQTAEAVHETAQKSSRELAGVAEVKAGDSSRDAKNSHGSLEDLVNQYKNQSSSIHDRRVSFHKHEGSGRTVISIVDPETEEVIQEFPQDQLLKSSERIKEIMGKLFDAEA